MLSLLCPPCPSRIVSKLAFWPPESTYQFLQDSQNENVNCNTVVCSNGQVNINNTSSNTNNSNNSNNSNSTDSLKYKLRLDDKADWQFLPSDLSNLEVFYSNYGRNQRLACMYVKACRNSKYTILFSHGNAADLGLMSSFYLSLGNKIGCDVFGYDYSGYGMSTGKPTEKNLYNNINIAWHELQTRYNLTPDKVILYGQSIGTVPTVDLATKHEFAGVILHSPLTSGLRLAFPNTKRTWFFDAFPNIDKMPKIKSPVLVIHGTEDEVIDISHGHAIHAVCKNAVNPLWVEGAGHNDIELFREYLERLKRFINHDILERNAY